MKSTVISLFLILFFLSSNAQTGILERTKENAKNKVNSRIETKIDKGVDKTLDKIEGIGKNKKGKDTTVVQTTENPTLEKGVSKGEKNEVSEDGGLKSYRKFDFVRGEKVLVQDNFETAEVGDFPVDWNTNASAEIVLQGDNSEKWLFLKQDGYFSPMSIVDFPENFTLEFDVYTKYRSSNIMNYGFEIGAAENPRKFVGGEIYNMNAAFRYTWLGCNEVSGFSVYEKGEVMNGNNELIANELKCSNDEQGFTKVHFSIWRQKNRIRVYLNENKVIDIPLGLPVQYKYNVFRFTTNYMNFASADNPDELMVTNLCYAIGAPDTRNKLITEGKLVTRGIQFNVNSAELKSESYGTMKEIAAVLTENPTVRIKIVGHTDSDGDDKANLGLSQKRAESVKKTLIEEFKIDGNRLETDGKGEAEPTDPNTTAAGKSNNRRVEFIKL